jgi:putative zinc finger protein
MKSLSRRSATREGGCDVQASGAIELYFYGELDAAEHAAIQAHLAACAECRDAQEELSIIRAALAARPQVSAPPGGDWSGFMSRLDRAVASEAALKGCATSAASEAALKGCATSAVSEAALKGCATSAASEAALKGRATSARRASYVAQPFRAAPARGRASYAGYLAMAALLALVTISVLMVGRAKPAVQPAQTPPAQAAAAASGPQVDPELMSVSERHLEKSKLVVLGLTAKDAGGREDWEYERELAGALLNDTRLYRLTAEQRGMTQLAGVLRDLEIVLLQTSLTGEHDAAALTQIQRLIRKRDLVEQMESVTTDSN